MKLALNCSIMFTEIPLLERPNAAKKAGFDAVEFWWPFATATPDKKDITNFVDAIKTAGVELIGLNFFAGDMPAGERGVLSHSDRTSEFRSSVDIAIEIGELLDCKSFNALYGLSLPGESKNAQDAVALENLEFAAKAVQSLGGQVLLEAVSGADAYPLKTAKDVISIIDRLVNEGGVHNVRFLYDIYHLAVNGDDLNQVVNDYFDAIGHIQVADYPGRHQPGTGDLDITSVLRSAFSRGYDGYIAMEYQPDGPSKESFDWLPSYRAALGERG